ncbi:MobF family relaxase [Nocardioides maradonensis]
MKFYTGSPKAARAYVEADHSSTDDYYLAEGTGLADRLIATPDGVTSASSMGGEEYERWVAGIDLATGKPKGRIRDDEHALRFVEVVINGPKTWSLAAALHTEISAALDAAQDRAAEQVIGWLAQHSTTRVGPRGRQVQVPVESMEAAVIRHYTSRAGDPHRHLHLQINARVFAEAKWRGLHSVGVRHSIDAINGIGHAAVVTDPEFRAVLSAHGFTMDEAGELAELAPYVGRFSARSAQIYRNLDRVEAEWRRDHPAEEPGRGLQSSWARLAWAQDRPDKVVPIDGAAMVSEWNELLHHLGYVDPPQVGLPFTNPGPTVGSIDRDQVADLVITRLGTARSAWNTADIRGQVEQHLAATGLITTAAARIELAEDITSRAVQRSVPLIDDPGVPEHVRALTSTRVLAVEAELVASMTHRAVQPSAPAAPPRDAGLDDAQTESVAALAGTGQLVVVEGAAGAGKTTVLAALRTELGRQGRRLVVVTPTLKAAQVVTDGTGIDASSAASLAREFGWTWDDDGHWTHHPDDSPIGPAALGPGDLLLVDEAGMIDQDTALALFQIADQVGARIALVGDRHQLPAVGRGGVLDLATRWANPDSVVGLDVIHRFTDLDYATLSLAMRRGEHPEEVFDQLWERGQIHLHATEPERFHDLATATAERIAAGDQQSVVMADTLAQVTSLNGAVRDQLVALGHVDDTRAVTTNAGERIGVGDRVATRLNDHGLGVANRDQWIVTAITDDGTLTLAPTSPNRRTGNALVREVPAWYVASRVELAYATTVYGAQGETTTVGHLLITDTTSGSAAYVSMTRGRDDNIAHLVADTPEQAKATWIRVMGRDRADLGPTHAATQAADEMERYAPQRPRHLVLAQLHKAWTRQADLARERDDLETFRHHATAVLTIRAAHAPKITKLREDARAAHHHAHQTRNQLKALAAGMAREEHDLVANLLDAWQHDQREAVTAAATVRNGAGRLGQRRRHVHDAQDHLDQWTQRWQHLMPDTTEHPEQQLLNLSADQARKVVAEHARDQVTHTHPEATQARSVAATADSLLEAAEANLNTVYDKLDAELAPHRRVARLRNLTTALTDAERRLDQLGLELDRVDNTVAALQRSPEIRSLPRDDLQAEHDQWQLTRTQEQAKARTTRRVDSLATRGVGTDPSHRPPARDRGPGLGL